MDSRPFQFDLEQARRAASEGALDQWLDSYLTTFNPALLSGLKLAQRFWVGPQLCTLSRLERCCGPEPDMEYQMTAAAWERRLAIMNDTFTRLEDFPPLIATLQRGRLSLRDGNHRHELFRRRGLTQCWTLVWYNTPHEQDAALRAEEASSDASMK